MEINERILFNLINAVPFFRGFTEVQAKALLTNSTQKKLNPNDVLLQEGSEGREMYLLLSGSMDVTAQGRKPPVAKILPIGVVGEIGMLLNYPRTATVTAAQPCQLIEFTKEKLDQAFKKDPQLELQLFRNLAAILCEKLLKNNLKIEDIAACHPGLGEK